jgi:hypothetical protein
VAFFCFVRYDIMRLEVVAIIAVDIFWWWPVVMAWLCKEGLVETRNAKSLVGRTLEVGFVHAESKASRGGIKNERMFQDARLRKEWESKWK